jgi:hypothetical protein
MGTSVPDPGRFAAAVTCIDGRTHEPLTRWVREQLGVDHVDLITRPGVDATLSDCSSGLCDGIREHLAVSATAHASRAVAIAGHDDCAGNPVPADEHRRQIADAVEQVRGWGLDMAVIGVWIEVDGTVTPIAGDTAGPVTADAVETVTGRTDVTAPT